MLFFFQIYFGNYQLVGNHHYQNVCIFASMETVLGILLFIFFVWALIKGWIWIVNSIMNPKIKKVEEEALKKNLKYQFWNSMEKIFYTLNNPPQKKNVDNNQPVNVYIAKHHRIVEGHKKAEELRASIKRGYKDLRKQYQDYLKWCEENNITPLVRDPDKEWPEVYSID